MIDKTELRLGLGAKHKLKPSCELKTQTKTELRKAQDENGNCNRSERPDQNRT